MRLIDADAINYPTINKFPDEQNEADMAFCEGVYHTFVAIAQLPTIEVEPVRHGRLEYDFSASIDETMWYYRCTSCGGSDIPYGDWSYCPHCGAKIEDVIN